MIVECPRCRARYRVEEEILNSDQTFKCSRCSHIFAYEAEESRSEAVSAPAGEVRPRVEATPAFERETSASDGMPSREPPPMRPLSEALKTPPRRNEQSLSFSFSRSAEESEPASESAAGRDAAAGRGRPSAPDYSFEDDEDFGSTDAASRDEPRFVREAEGLRIEREPERSPGRAYLLYLGMLVVVYGVFALDLRNHPDRSAKLLASIPVVGEVLAEDKLLQTRVQLEEVEGAFQQIKDDRLVFIISGRAVNASPEALKGVQIESALYDGSGRVLDSKSIYCGNAMSLKIVRDLSTKEISLLQRLEPPKRFEIRPGEAAGFSVVFLNPPAGVKEFSARVLAAQGSG